MNVREAVASRYSCRAFRSDPVSEALVRDLVERAGRAPSAGNVQPWRVDVIAGSVLEELKALLRPRMSELPHGEGGEYEVYPRDLAEEYRNRRFEVPAPVNARQQAAGRPFAGERVEERFRGPLLGRGTGQRHCPIGRHEGACNRAICE